MENINAKKQRRLVFDGLLILIFSLITARFFYLQIVRGEHYWVESEKNRIREIVIQPTRGLIYDRNKKLLVDNEPAYSVVGIPYDLEKSDSVFFYLSRILDIPIDILIDKVKNNQWGKFQPIKLKRDIDFRTLSELEENNLDLPGVEYYIEPRRYYPTPIHASHVLGYISEISRDELLYFGNRYYQQGDIIGKTGLEKVYENVLRGEKGVYYMEVDALGRKIRTLDKEKAIPPVPGKNIILTLDARLQELAEKEIEGKRGAVVVLDARDGGVLAVSSKPDYDLAFFSRPRSSDDWRELANDPGHPLYHRAVQSIYPPGSTFKLVLACAAIEEQSVDLDWKVHCPGYKRVGNRIFQCWKSGGHGNITLISAIEQSCNVYFYNLIYQVGFDKWVEYGKKFGFGKTTGIDISNENSGLLPNSVFMNQKYGRSNWERGQMCNLAIGQGDILATPTQMALFAMIIGNQGTYYRPHIVKGIQDATRKHYQDIPLQSRSVAGISLQTFQLLKRAMYRVVHGENGTARGLYLPGVTIGGKTGTAENPHGDSHAWFIGFAPFKNPEVAVCVFIENGGAGSSAAVPVAQKILSSYFHKF